MIQLFLALAGLALAAAPVSARAAEPAQASKSKPSKAKSSKAADKKAEDEKAEEMPEPSAETRRVADWIAASGDNQDLPYLIIDKNAATAYLFDAEGEDHGQAPVLIGVAVGDDATPGIGSKNLAEIGPAEKTTPAGRFLAKFGMAAGRQRVLWVDYSTSVALHMIPKGANKKEKRRERMLSKTSDDNRITFGCINVPIVFYTKSLTPLFRKEGGYVYVLPDTKPLETVFPRLVFQAAMNGGMH